MGQLLKMIPKCISDRWNWNDQTIIDSSSSPNAIERLPIDVFMKILKLLDPKDVARLSCVCKWLKEIVSDDKLWKYFLQNQNQDHWLSTLFAEMNLRHGSPLRSFPVKELSFKHVYGERAKEPRPIIIDVGTGHYKLGWSNDDSPSVRLQTFMEFVNTGAPLVHDIFETIYRRMHTYPSKQPVIISTAIRHYGEPSGAYSSDFLRSILFEKGVPAVCIVNQAILAMFSATRTSGILVNIGHSETKVYPIINGVIWYKAAVESVRVGGFHLTRYLDKQLRQRNIHVSSFSTARLLKEKLCYVALDYEAELLKDTEASHRVGSSSSYTLKQERFRTGELLFQPQLAGINERGLHQAVAECINHCSEVDVKSDHDWFKTIVLAGGTARLPRLAERLEKELQDLLPPSVSNGICVIASPYGEDAAWHGAKLVSNLSTFTDSWCIKPPPTPKLVTARESTMIFVCLFMVSCFIESVKRKKSL